MNIGDLTIANFMLGDTQALKVCLGDETVWEKEEPTPSGYSNQYLTFEVLSGGNLYWLDSLGDGLTIEYSINNGPWQSVSASFNGTPISANDGDVIRFRGQNEYYSDYSGWRTYFSGGTMVFNLYGNILSMMYGDNFTGHTETPTDSSFNFQRFFYGTNVVSAEHLVLPDYTTKYCYDSMFRSCTGLTTAPVLPALIVSERAYSFMFQGCTSLTTAPELPATTLATYCYQYMFRDCTSLTTAPELPATTLATYCYGNMFQGCTSLTTAPELPATTLAKNCYYWMFQACQNLNYIKCLATNISATNCTSNWVNGVSSTGTFVKNASMSNWTTGSKGIPTNWTVQDAVF